MTEGFATQEIARGLKDVVLDTTETSFIDGAAGKLLYNGYNIHDLAEQSTFEEVTFLLWHKRLPTRSELDRFDVRLKASRTLPPPIIAVIRLVPQAHPMDALRTAVSALAAFDPDASDVSEEARLRKATRITAQVPTIMAAHDRIRQGKDPVAPIDTLSHTANFLYMLHGKEPDEDAARAIDIDLILHAEHGSNASAFAARVTASTESDLHSAIVSAIGTLKGPRHGGAAEAVMRMVEEIGEVDRVDEYIQHMLAEGRRIMGMGHRVYKVEDPRARHMRERARLLGEKLGQPKWYQILQRIVEVTTPLRARGISLNVDFYAGAVYYLLGIPEDLFICMFAMGRVPGWCAQVFEHWRDNVLIRPLLHYTGPMDLEYVPLDQRE
ncbi:MAG: citrate (Si)-synthase [Chloroflexi bacterium]|nr:citrate (Si)-synthase [Chloroflexota bacterium]